MCFNEPSKVISFVRNSNNLKSWYKFFEIDIDIDFRGKTCLMIFGQFLVIVLLFSFGFSSKTRLLGYSASI